MIHNAGEIRIGKGDAVMRVIAQEISRRRLSAIAEEKTRLRAQVRVSPSVQDDAGDVIFRVKSQILKHHGKLFTNFSLVGAKGRRVEFRTSAADLLLDGQAG